MAKTIFEQLKEIDPVFANDVQKLSNDDLLRKIVSFLEEKQAIDEAQKKDPDIQSLSEELKTAKETYSIPRKTINLKVRFVLDTLQSRKFVK